MAGAWPQRIVSLNPCLDAILLALVSPARVAAVSHYARDPQSSPIAEAAQRIPIVYETAEEVLALRPDLVLASRHNARATRDVLARLGRSVALFDVPDRVQDGQDQILRIAALTGAMARGEALLRQIDAAFAAARAPEGSRPVAAVLFGARGFAAGQGTLPDELLTRCGFTNAAARYGLKSWGNVALEDLIADPPEVLLTGETRPGEPGWADRIGRHPVLTALSDRMLQAVLPQRLTYCAGPSLIEATQRLRAIHAVAMARRKRA